MSTSSRANQPGVFFAFSEPGFLAFARMRVRQEVVLNLRERRTAMKIKSSVKAGQFAFNR
jgi:hypothetical protein